MLKISTSIENGICFVKMTGAINESSPVNFDYGSAREVHIDCGSIARMNSMGVRNWSAWFEKLRLENIKLRFSNLSVALISQCNFVLGIVAANEVESLAIPYFCESCTKEFVVMRSTSEIRSTNYIVPPLTCPFCNSTAEFDGSPVSYFTFMT